jgi:hypothetical protein
VVVIVAVLIAILSWDARDDLPQKSSYTVDLHDAAIAIQPCIPSISLAQLARCEDRCSQADLLLALSGNGYGEEPSVCAW